MPKTSSTIDWRSLLCSEAEAAEIFEHLAFAWLGPAGVVRGAARELTKLSAHDPTWQGRMTPGRLQVPLGVRLVPLLLASALALPFPTDSAAQDCPTPQPDPLGSWSFAGPLSASRGFHTATPLTTAEVLIVGGASGGIALDMRSHFFGMYFIKYITVLHDWK